MSNAIVRATLKSLVVRFNGDQDDNHGKQLRKLDRLEAKRKNLEEGLRTNPTVEAINNIEALSKKIYDLKESAQDNAVICKLSYPRSGSSSVESLKKVRLPSTKPGDPRPISHQRPVFLKHGLFKEEIQGETLLQVAVTDSDPRNTFLQFFRRVLSIAFSSVSKGLISDISGVITNSAANVLSKDIAESLVGGKRKRVQLVAISDTVAVHVAADASISVTQLKRGSSSFQNGILTLKLKAPQYLKLNETTYLPRGATNGEIQIAIDSEAL